MSANFKQLYWNRVGFVEIEDEYGRMIRYGSSNPNSNPLDFKFDITKTGNGIYTDFTVSVLGLNRNTINSLVTWKSPDSVSNARKIKVYAGYYDRNMKNSGAGLIATGGIIQAEPTNPPDMWLNMMCRFGVGISHPVPVPYNTRARLVNIFKEISRYTGFTFDENTSWKTSELKDRVADFTFSGPIDQLLAKASNDLHLSVFENNGMIFVYDEKAEYSDPKSENLPVLNVDSGLLSIGNIDIKGIDISMRLNDTPFIGEWIRVESVLIPKASGKYMVRRKRHIGHLRGQEWMTNLLGVRYQ